MVGPEYFTVLVLDGLRVHTVHKNAHSAIRKACESKMKRGALPSEESDDYRFMVVRHPLERIVSAGAFFSHRNTKNLHDYMEKLGYRNGMSFDKWISILLLRHEENIHTQKQVLFTGGHHIHELCPIEQLSSRWVSLQERFDLDDLPPKGFNSSPHGDWKAYYTDEQREAAEYVFKEDIDLYNRALNWEKDNG